MKVTCLSSESGETVKSRFVSSFDRFNIHKINSGAHVNRNCEALIPPTASSVLLRTSLQSSKTPHHTHQHTHITPHTHTQHTQTHTHTHTHTHAHTPHTHTHNTHSRTHTHQTHSWHTHINTRKNCFLAVGGCNHAPRAGLTDAVGFADPLRNFNKEWETEVTTGCHIVPAKIIGCVQPRGFQTSLISDVFSLFSLISRR